jgi:hypothetical protein
MLTIQNQLEGAYLGQDVALDCLTEAYPTSINYWTTERGDMIVSGEWLASSFVRISLRVAGNNRAYTLISKTKLHFDVDLTGCAVKMYKELSDCNSQRSCS